MRLVYTFIALVYSGGASPHICGARTPGGTERSVEVIYIGGLRCDLQSWFDQIKEDNNTIGNSYVRGLYRE